jgi:hypothetical protein
LHDFFVDGTEVEDKDGDRSGAEGEKEGIIRVSHT